MPAIKYTNNELMDLVNKKLRGLGIPQQFQNAITENEGVILLPQQLKGDIEEAKLYNKAARQFVHVIPVDTREGRYTTEDEGDFSELKEFSDSVQIPEIDAKFKAVNWDLRRYGSFTKVTEEVYNDNGFNLTKFFSNKHAEKATKTENKLIFNAIKTELTAKSLADVQALNSSLNKDLNPALEKEIVILTNQDGYELIKESVIIENGKRYYDVYQVEVYSNDELPSTNGKAPFIYGAMKRVVKLFTNDTVDVLTTKKSVGFLNAYHVIRGVESYDVQLMPETAQLLLGEIPLV